MFPWLPCLTYLVVSSLSPGPNTLSSLSIAGRQGLRRAIPFNLGVYAGVFVAACLCAALCEALSALLEVLRRPMLLLAAGYLLLLAWRLWRSGSLTERDDARSGFLTALLFQFVNPNLYIYVILALEVYILPHFGGQPLPILGLILLLSTVAFAATMAWSVFGSLFRRLFTQYAKVSNGVMALALAWCAVALFL